VFIRIRGVLRELWGAVDQDGVAQEVWCRTGETARLLRASSSTGCMGGSTNHDAS
jgi:hypothetical protein